MPEPSEPQQQFAQLSVADRIRVATFRFTREMRRAVDSDALTFSMQTALAEIERHDAITLGELARIERVEAPAMTRIITKLSELGFVERVTDPNDRRSATVSLTPAGADYLAHNRLVRSEFVNARLSRLTDDEQETLIAALPLILRMAEADPQPMRRVGS